MKTVFSTATEANESVDRGFPTLLRPTSGRVQLWLPYRASGRHNREWIKTGFGTGVSLRPQLRQPQNVWLVGRKHLGLVVDEVAYECGFIDVYLQFKEGQICNESCVKAKLDECVCSCLGTNHRGGLYPQGLRIRSRPIEDGITEVFTRVMRGESWNSAGAVVSLGANAS